MLHTFVAKEYHRQRLAISSRKGPLSAMLVWQTFINDLSYLTVRIN